MKKNALISSILTIALCVSLIAGSTFALFTSESKVNVAVTAANVEVVATAENDRLTSTLGNNLPETDYTIVDNTITLTKIVPGDVLTFDLRIKNNSDVSIKYRTIITKVADDGLWNGLEVTIDGTIYDGTSKVSTWETAAPGSADIIVPVKVTLPESAGNEYKLKTCTLAYTVEAVQGNADVTDAPAGDSATTAYYTVATAEELKTLAGTTLPNGAVIDIVSDIDLAGTEIPAIAAAYGGTLTVNGNSNVISNASVKTPGKQNGMDNYGLFYVHTNGTLTVNNLTIDGATVEATSDNYGTAVIVGYADGGSTVNLKNVDVKNSSVTNAYDEAAIYVSYCTGNINMTDCDVINCTVAGENSTNKTSVGIGHLNGGTAVLNNCTEDNATYDWCHRDDGVLIVINNGIAAVSNDKGLDAAITAGEQTIELGSGNYIIPDSAQGKTLTIIGNGNTVVATQDDGSYEGCDYSLDGANVTFEGITITTDSSTYTGYARCSATYNNCTINGAYTLYGESIFNNCTFNVTGDNYNIWTWGGKVVEFNNCTFNTDGKSILVYTQNCDVYVNDCKFYDNGTTDLKKAAIETGVDNADTKYNIYINNSEFNGFSVTTQNATTYGGSDLGTNVWGNKNLLTTDKLNVVIDGVDVH
ncbi:MAG: hypothetical protein IKJ13_02755 [Clostridia bacterium]|nr:hypothetical protein [Clostridia bacterium]